MARKSKEEVQQNQEPMELASEDLSEKLGMAFEQIITQQYGYARAPRPYMTPTGIRHLDAILGGGLTSSAPVMLSSTPETGKSTFAFEFAKIFQTIYTNSVVVYLDIEGAANKAEGESFQKSRMEIFGLDGKRFRYEHVVMDIMKIFELIETLAAIKRKFEEKLNKEFYVLIILDSLAAAPSSKVEGAEDPNKTIGRKARELSFCLDKYSSLFTHNRISFVTIDQVRANIKIEGPYVQKERSVGTFKDYRAATSVANLNHRVSQWLFLSKGAKIVPADGFGVDGWYLNLYTEKCKSAPSGFAITCVFDKLNGIHKFWSEYEFLSDYSPAEKKFYKDKQPFNLNIVGSGAYSKLYVFDPNSGNKEYESDSFYKRDALYLYNNDATFKKWFDYAMDCAVYMRIINGLFRLTNIEEKELLPIEVDENTVADQIVNSTLGSSDSSSPAPPEVDPIVKEADEKGELYQSIFD